MFFFGLSISIIKYFFLVSKYIYFYNVVNGFIFRLLYFEILCKGILGIKDSY